MRWAMLAAPILLVTPAGAQVPVPGSLPVPRQGTLAGAVAPPANAGPPLFVIPTSPPVGSARHLALLEV
jgi:hypothetical protein